MNALFLYSDASGQGKLLKELPNVISRLRHVFPQLIVHKTSSEQDLFDKSKAACGRFSALIIAGGDGSFDVALNAVAPEKKRPILGYINAGTIGDIGRNFGISHDLNKALKIIEKGYHAPFDVAKINDRYFAYVAAIGSFSDIAYLTPRKAKKRLGAVAYYTKAVGEALRPSRVYADIEADGKHYHVKTPFILLLNGRYVGGFLVNDRGQINDGKMELYLTKPGLFNGLVNYLFFKMRTQKIKASHFSIHPDVEMPWCLDGEQGPKGDIDVTCLHNQMEIFANPKKLKK